MAGTMEYSFQDPQSGDTHSVTDADLVTQLKAAGQDVQGVSADGRTLTINQGAPDGKGKAQALQVPAENALKALGYNVTGMKPTAADNAHVDDWLSAKLQSLPDDDLMKKTYVQSTLTHRGVKAPMVAGSGNDWHVFNPESNQWVQVTRDPGLNMAGLYSAGLALPHMVGAGLGGTAGAAAGLPGGGVGAVPGALVGGALGSAAGKAATNAVLGMTDDDYRAALDSNQGHELADIGWTGAKDGLGMGAGKLLGGAAPISKALQAAGGGLDAAGSVAAKTAGSLAGSEALLPFATDLTPGLGPVSGVGQAAQLPGVMMRGATSAAQNLRKVAPWLGGKVTNWLGEDAGQTFSSKLGGAIDRVTEPVSSYADTLLEPRPMAAQGLKQNIQAAAENVGERLGNAPKPPVAQESDILGNAVSFGRAKGAYAADPEWALSEEHAADAASQLAARSGASPAEEEQLVQAARRAHRSDALKQMVSADRATPNWGSKAGGYIQDARRAGEGIQNAANTTLKAGLRGVQGAGYAAQGVGTAARALGTVAQPLELPMGLRYGGPEVMSKVRNWWDDQTQNP